MFNFREKRKSESKESKTDQPVASSEPIPIPEPEASRSVEVSNVPRPESAAKKAETPIPTTTTSELMIDLTSSPVDEKLLLKQRSPAVAASKFSTSTIDFQSFCIVQLTASYVSKNACLITEEIYIESSNGQVWCIFRHVICFMWTYIYVKNNANKLWRHIMS